MSNFTHPDSFRARARLRVGGETYEMFRLAVVPGVDRLPYSLRILLESLLRHEGAAGTTASHVEQLMAWRADAEPSTEIPFAPARVVMPDSTGVPCLVDLAAMREAVGELGGDPHSVNPRIPADLIVDHSLQVDHFGTPTALSENVALEYHRNAERYAFLRWGQGAIDRLRIVPPGAGIIHQVNLEYLATVVTGRNGVAFPDSCVGTDSHTPMVNGLGVLAWGVGGIEAEAALLGQPIPLLVPRVVGVRLSGAVQPGVTTTDVVLTITELLRAHGVVGSFVEFFGEGMSSLPVADRATIANMAPEYGATVGLFPIDEETLRYLRLTGRNDQQLALVEAYAKEQGLWHAAEHTVDYSEIIDLDLSTIVASIAGPTRPQDRIPLSRAKESVSDVLAMYASSPAVSTGEQLTNGSVVIAAITSCTNTSNPTVMIGAGLLARKARARGLRPKPWVKTSMAPGSRVVTAYLERAGLTTHLEALGFHLAGYGCATCIGNSGPLPAHVASTVREDDLTVAAVLSGNRNFEGRINPDVKLNYLASPALVVAYSIAGTMEIDFEHDPLGVDPEGREVFLRDIWPSPSETSEALATVVTRQLFVDGYAGAFDGDEHWKALEATQTDQFQWDLDSTYIRRPPFLDDLTPRPGPVSDITGARVLARLGDSVTTDHISPAGVIPPQSPAGRYLLDLGIAPSEFNSYLARRGNHEVMMRGTFANVRLRNLLLDGVSGGRTRDFTRPDGPETSIFEATQRYREAGIPLVVLAGKEYGTGSSRDWAAKGPFLLGVRAVLAESFERIHRSNLIGLGIAPLQFVPGESAETLRLVGTEVYDIRGLAAITTGPVPETVTVQARQPDGATITFQARLRIDTPIEADYFRHQGLLPFLARRMASAQ